MTFACFLGISLAAWHGPLAGGSPADKYPAGVSPQACPNYPHCDNPAVAANPSGPSHGAWNGGWNGGHAGGWNGGHAGGWNGGAGAGGWNGAGAGGAGGWNGGDHGSWNQNALDNGEYTGDGDYRGEGLAESGAYGDISHNYNSDNGAWNGAGAGGGWNGAGAGGWNGAGHAGHAAQVPAGVDPHACPNYPFCH